ncbi:Propionyl-CoA carboxylase [Thermaerobacter marianensis DSM 12885]|uniref:Propionyl-CoA carboxylase n=1 Tax=Thermaerobacter marianensis (strain ATCC 700841 / DSM 12885 / JCM 10246 / 7p75a) TaxID=644966 RepID=E6SML1_THEM7|nr:acyl-CoA carboxylase subunit beta [Thermaerobacter marianensis]ADU51503.1 Propionyl-CoA carboxylase [Thermaerobacter marianensis DSM 12885]
MSGGTAELDRQLLERLATVRRGGPERYHEKNRQQGKLFARERLERLLDPGSFVEDGTLANVLAGDLPADGVITGLGRIGGRTVAVMANDSTVKAGSWGARTVEKILRIQEQALRQRVPMLYLVDSAGARITDQVEMFPGRRGAGRIFYNQVRMSGVVPQVCLLFGPSAAGGAYIPAFCDVVIMVEGNASMYLGSPRMAEMVIGEKVTLEEMGGARMHCTVSGCGDVLVSTEEEAIAAARTYLSYFPSHWEERPPRGQPRPPAPGPDVDQIVPANANVPFDMYRLIQRLVDEDSFFEIKRLFAPEIITGLARIEGRVVGVVANQPRVRGGVLFVDSADKAARFVWLCNAFNIPLLFLADVPGFMIGSAVERQGIIRHGAKMIAAVAEAEVPKISVIVRKAYGAGLYAMAGPAFGPDACLALPTAQIAVMGPEAAVNAVYYHHIARLEGEERQRFVEEKRQEYAQDIDIYRMASDLVVDEVVPGHRLRDELARRFALYENRRRQWPARHSPVHPV